MRDKDEKFFTGFGGNIFAGPDNDWQTKNHGRFVVHTLWFGRAGDISCNTDWVAQYDDKLCAGG